MVDAGREWIERYAEEQPALKAALADGAVERRAHRVTTLWHRACEERVAELRRSEAIRSQMNLSHLHRTCTELTRALVTKVRPGCCAAPAHAADAPPARVLSTTRSPPSCPSRWTACSAGRVRLRARAASWLALTRPLPALQSS